MAGEKLSWMFELLDRMSGPADRIAKKLKVLEPALKTTGTGASTFARAIGFIGQKFGPQAAGAVLRFASSVTNLGQKLGPVLKPIAGLLGKVGTGVAKGLAVAGTAMIAVGAAAAAAVGGLAIAGGRWALESIAFKETTIASLEAILGTKQAAEEVFNKATKFAAKTPFSTSQVAAAFERLVSAGVEVKDLEKTMQSLGDFAGTDLSKLEGAISVIAQIKGKGKLQGEELMQLAERGLPMGKVLDALALKLGKTKDEVQSLLSAGKIDSATGIGAIMSVIDGTFGGRMEKASNTLEGLWSTLKSVPEDLLFSEGAAKSIEKMVGPIKDMIKGFTAALAPDTENGKRLIAMFDQIAATVGGIFGGFKADDISSTIKSILNVAEPLLTVFLAWGKALVGGLGSVLGPVVKWLGELSKDPKALAELTQAFATVGSVVGKVLGVVIVIVGAILALDVAIMGLVGSVVDFATSAWASISSFLSGVRKQLQPFIDQFMAAWGQLTAAFSELWTRLKPQLAAIAEPLVGGLAVAWGAIKGIIALLAKGAFIVALAAIRDAFEAIVNTVKFLAKAIGFVIDVVDTVKKTLGDFGLIDPGAGPFDWLTQGIAGLQGAVGTLGATWTAITTFFTDLWNSVATMSWQELGMSIVRGILDGILAMLGPAGGVMGSLGATLFNAIKPGAPSPVPPVPGAPVVAPIVPPPPSMFGAAIQLGAGVPPAANAIQPGAPVGSTTGAGAGAAATKEQTFQISIPQIIIQVMSGEDPASAGKRAADSFSSQLGAALKGLSGEAGL